MESVSNQLITTTKQWIQIDQEIHKLTAHLNQLREKKDKLEKQTIYMIKKEGLENTALAFNQCKIYVGNEKVFKPSNYTQKYIEEQLCKLITDKGQVKMICQHLKNGRTIENKKVIKKGISQNVLKK